MSRVFDPSSNSIDLLSHSSKFGTASEACVFNLLPKDACKNGIATELCMGCCYTFRMVADRPESYRFIEKNFALSKRADFAPRMIYHIRQANVPDFRIHSSGDFYSEDYLHAWIRIVVPPPNLWWRFVGFLDPSASGSGAGRGGPFRTVPLGIGPTWVRPTPRVTELQGPGGTDCCSGRNGQHMVRGRDRKVHRSRIR